VICNLVSLHPLSLVHYRLYSNHFCFRTDLREYFNLLLHHCYYLGIIVVLLVLGFCFIFPLLIYCNFPSSVSVDAYDFSAPDDTEWRVDELNSHRWSGKNLEFQVCWNTGETTWEPLESCKELAALDGYLTLMGVKHWKQLPRKAAARAAQHWERWAGHHWYGGQWWNGRGNYQVQFGLVSILIGK